MSKIKRSRIWIIILLFTTSCLAQPSANLPTDPFLNESITTYLVEEVGINGFGGEVFCAFEYLDSNKDADGNIFIWALCQEYYLAGDSITEGSGTSLPVALQTQSANGQVVIIGHRVPGDGSYYGPDVREIFPRSTWSQIMPKKGEGLNQYNLRASELSNETRMIATEYFLAAD